MSNLYDKLSKAFFKKEFENSTELIKLLSLDDESREKLFEKEPSKFNQFFKIEEPTTESDNETIKPERMNPIKHENFNTYSDDEKPEPSHRYRKNNNYEFKMPMHKGIPDTTADKTPIKIGILNLDCVTDMQVKEEMIKRWITEISLIIQTNEDDFTTAKKVLLLIEHKTSGNVQNFIKNMIWEDIALALEPVDFLDAINSLLYTFFLGIDFVTHRLQESEIKIAEAKQKMTKLQLHNISAFDEFCCRYEKYLWEIPNVFEHMQWIESFIQKLPIISKKVLKRYNDPLLSNGEKASFAVAKRIAKEEIAKICENRYEQKQLKQLTKTCCSKLTGEENFDIGRSSSKRISKKHYKKKYKKKYKKYTFHKKKKRFSKGKYFQKSKDLNKKSKDKSCPQGKKKCRCWICNEEGHYANECPNRRKYPEKVHILQCADQEGLIPLEEEYIDIQNVYLFISEDESDTSNSEVSSESDDYTESD